MPHLPDRRRLLAASLGLLAAGCAPLRPPITTSERWSGRLSLAVRGPSPQSFSTGFELSGNALKGELLLTSPLGISLAQARWEPGQALLDAGSKSRRFDSMESLLEDLTGAALPLAALFDWLRGISTPVAGWEADLAQQSQGRLSARRLSPAPQVELRLLIDQ